MDLPELTGYTDGELLRLWARVMSALQDRDVIRSANNPVGDLCEGLVAKHFGVAVETQSTKGYDVLADGVRYQVKGRRSTPRSKPSHYSPIRNIDAHEFDFVLAVHLDEDFEVTDAWKVSYEAVKRLAHPAPHVNGVRLSLIRGPLMHEAGVEPFALILPA